MTEKNTKVLQPKTMAWLFGHPEQGKNGRIIFHPSGLQVKLLKQSVRFTWEEIKAVKVTGQGKKKYIHIYSDTQIARIPYNYFDGEEILVLLQQNLPSKVFNSKAYQTTQQYQDWRKSSWREFSTLAQPLKVPCSLMERWAGVIFTIMGIVIWGVLYPGGSMVAANCFGIPLIGLGLFMLLGSLIWITASDQEVTVRVLFWQNSIVWDKIIDIYVNSRQGVIAFKNADDRVILPKASSWTGKDRDLLQAMIDYKVEVLGIEPIETTKMINWFSRNLGG